MGQKPPHYLQDGDVMELANLIGRVAELADQGELALEGGRDV